ncbi:hypothetical protein D3C86_1665460 [compost metagenome]
MEWRRSCEFGIGRVIGYISNNSFSLPPAVPLNVIHGFGATVHDRFGSGCHLVGNSFLYHQTKRVFELANGQIWLNAWLCIKGVIE